MSFLLRDKLLWPKLYKLILFIALFC